MEFPKSLGRSDYDTNSWKWFQTGTDTDHEAAFQNGV